MLDGNCAKSTETCFWNLVAKNWRQFGNDRMTTLSYITHSACLCMVTHTYSKRMDQPGKVANPPARGQLNREGE